MLSRAMALWALIVLCLANLLNYIDRQVVSALEAPLEEGLHLDKVEFGLLWTLFTVGYAVCAIPFGFLADRLSRTRLLAFAIFIWSGATVASGLAQTREVLYIARVLTGVGEAGCLVIGPSLISDLYHRTARGRAMGLFYLGMPVGGTLAFFLAAMLLNANWDGFYSRFDIPPEWHAAYLAEPWRNIFYVVGLPGLLIGLLLLMLPDPPRGLGDGVPHGLPKARFLDYARLLATPTLMLTILAQGFSVVMLVPLIHYGVEYFVEVRGMEPFQARIALAAIALVAGIIGNVASGQIGDTLARRRVGAYSILAAVGYLLSWPCFLVGLTAPSPWVFLPALTLGAGFVFLCMPAVNTQIANVVIPQQRATAWALAGFILHIGDASAAPLFGLTDQAVGRQTAFLCFSLALLPASLCCAIAIATASGDTARAQKRVDVDPSA